VTVLRNGMRVFTGPVAQTSRQDIILHMTARALTDGFPAKDTPADGPVAQAAELATKALMGLNFTLHRGEIPRICGLAGAGQTKMLNLFLGLERATAGTPTLEGQPGPQNAVAGLGARGGSPACHTRRPLPGNGLIANRERGR